MSAVEYTKCDACGNFTQGHPADVAWNCPLGWGRLIVEGKSWDLCPECAERAKKAAGVE